MPQLHPVLKSSPVITRFPGNPVLQHSDVPYPSTLVFNAGVAKFKGQYVMMFRNDFGRWGDPRFDGTNLGLATSADGLKWNVQPGVCWSHEDPAVQAFTRSDVTRIYDPRLTVIDHRCYICFACDTKHGLRGGVAVTDDLQHFEVLSLSVPDNRNMALFPEKIAGKFARLERPMPIYSRWGKDRFDMWYSDSADARYWGNHQLVAAVEDFPFANDKIGPAAPPIRTPKGWLTIVHCVDRDDTRGQNGWEPTWKKRYTAGVVLLDLHDPSRMVGLCQDPLIAPEAPYEADIGFRQQVIFPCGCMLEGKDEVRIYYGAADTCVCLATAKLDDLLALCTPR